MIQWILQWYETLYVDYLLDLQFEKYEIRMMYNEVEIVCWRPIEIDLGIIIKRKSFLNMIH